MDQLIAEIKKIPPVTRFLVASSLGVTVPVLMKLVSPYSIVFFRPLVTKKLQIWRLYTSFFLGGDGLAYLFDLVMLYRTANDIETRSYPNRSSDLAWQTFWAGGAILAASLPLNGMLFFRPLLICLVYLYSSLAPPGAQTSIMGLVTIPIVFYPYVLIGMDFVVYGTGGAAMAVAGAAVGHLWWWTVWGGELGSRGLLGPYSNAPQWLRILFGEDGRPAQPPAAGGAAEGLARSGVHVTAPRPPPGAAAGSSTGHSWGSGRRLGT
ncbi:DER1-domain-containing protein [Pholiota conissans]|uniref:Derlin n=1 Tax=Pholiota conissans TaxID=109636 RepID=A0A9P5ZFK2_9AGAR|nr:DER1-domain-containing protein [Pholiota conissans]